MVRRISSSRPITGSIFPWRAISTRSRPYFSKCLVLGFRVLIADPLAAANILEGVENGVVVHAGG